MSIQKLSPELASAVIHLLPLNSICSFRLANRWTEKSSFVDLAKRAFHTTITKASEGALERLITIVQDSPAIAQAIHTLTIAFAGDEPQIWAHIMRPVSIGLGGESCPSHSKAILRQLLWMLPELQSLGVIGYDKNDMRKFQRRGFVTTALSGLGQVTMPGSWPGTREGLPCRHLTSFCVAGVYVYSSELAQVLRARASALKRVQILGVWSFDGENLAVLETMRSALLRLESVRLSTLSVHGAGHDRQLVRFVAGRGQRLQRMWKCEGGKQMLVVQESTMQLEGRRAVEEGLRVAVEYVASG